MIVRNARLSLVAACLTVLAGCSSSPNADIEPADDAGPAGDKGSTSKIIPDDGGIVPGKVPSVVYANTEDTLYRFDPVASKVERVGVFDCVSLPATDASGQGMQDLAINAQGEMFGVGLRPGGYGLFSIDKTTAKCKAVGPDNTNEPLSGLTFVPASVFNDGGDALIATSIEGKFFRIDPKTGKITSLGGTQDVSGSKGTDVVSVTGAGTFLTGGGGDRLYMIDPATGKLLKDIGSLGAEKDFVAGLAYWGGKVYGFSYGGKILEIDPLTAETKSIPYGALGSAGVEGGPLHFWGAAVETNAPIVRPN